MSDVLISLHTESQAATALVQSLNYLLADDEEARADAVEGETNLNEAISDAVKRLIELEAMRESIGKMIADLKARNNRFEAQHERIRTAIGMAMEAVNLRKLELPTATISLKAVPPKVEITDESIIPAVFFKTQEPKLDKLELMRALKDKQDVPGAILSNGGLTISVRQS